VRVRAAGGAGSGGGAKRGARREDGKFSGVNKSGDGLICYDGSGHGVSHLHWKQGWVTCGAVQVFNTLTRDAQPPTGEVVICRTLFCANGDAGQNAIPARVRAMRTCEDKVILSRML
jgi:hypothetical protein